MWCLTNSASRADRGSLNLAVHVESFITPAVQSGHRCSILSFGPALGSIHRMQLLSSQSSHLESPNACHMRVGMLEAALKCLQCWYRLCQNHLEFVGLNVTINEATSGARC